VKKGDEQKNAKKTQTEESLWKLTPLMEIRTKRGLPPRLEKAAPTTLGFFTVPTSATAAVPSTLTKSNKLPRTWAASSRRAD
jgi:hypothetical protein